MGAQKEHLRKEAIHRGMKEIGEYSDEGKSGKNIKGRPEFQRMLTDIRTKKDDVDYVLVFKLSRLDFFASSSTIAHAIMTYIVGNNGKRKFIRIQLSENINEKSEAYANWYRVITEIDKECIRRSWVKIKDESLLTILRLDTSFRVLKYDSTNMKNVSYNPAEYEPSLLRTLTDNVKEDRTPENFPFQVMLDLGVLLSSKIEQTVIHGKKVFNVADVFLLLSSIRM